MPGAQRSYSTPVHTLTRHVLRARLVPGAAGRRGAPGLPTSRNQELAEEQDPRRSGVLRASAAHTYSTLITSRAPCQASPQVPTTHPHSNPRAGGSLRMRVWKAGAERPSSLLKTWPPSGRVGVTRGQARSLSSWASVSLGTERAGSWDSDPGLRVPRSRSGMEGTGW